MIRLPFRVILGLALLIVPLATSFADESSVAARAPKTDWPRWRGPNADGAADNRSLPVRWSQTENIRWSVKLPGWGTSSPVVHRGRVFVTSQAEEKGKKSLLLLCFQGTDGKELWRHDFGFGVNQRTHEKSNLAVNTPAVTDDAVYVAFGNADIGRYSHDGKLRWVRRYLADFGDPKMAWGYAISPLVVDDAVVFPGTTTRGHASWSALTTVRARSLGRRSGPLGPPTQPRC